MDASNFVFVLFLVIQVGTMILIKKSLGFGVFDAVPGKLTGAKRYIALWNPVIAVLVAFLVVYFVVVPIYIHIS